MTDSTQSNYCNRSKYLKSGQTSISSSGEMEREKPDRTCREDNGYVLRQPHWLGWLESCTDRPLPCQSAWRLFLCALRIAKDWWWRCMTFELRRGIGALGEVRGMWWGRMSWWAVICRWGQRRWLDFLMRRIEEVMELKHQRVWWLLHSCDYVTCQALR